MIESLYSEFDADISIRSANSKTFDAKKINVGNLKKIKGVKNTSKAIEEIVVIQQDQRWANAKLIAVDDNFLNIAKIPDHLINGFPALYENGRPSAIIGALLIEKVNAYFTNSDLGQILIHFPKRDSKMNISENPFNTEQVRISGRVNYNKEVNSEALILPLEFAQKALEYQNDITSLYVEIDQKNKGSLEKIKRKIQESVSNDFIVETHFEKNKIIYQTSKTEKLIVIAILVFVFIMASFNLIASLTMLYIEKKSDISTLRTLGASSNDIFKIFFNEGILICGKGILWGLTIGTIVCFSQIYFAIIKMPNSMDQGFPISLRIPDYLLVLTLVGSLSVLFSLLTVKFIVNKSKETIVRD